jgi:biopolymer transport protein ExbB
MIGVSAKSAVVGALGWAVALRATSTWAQGNSVPLGTETPRDLAPSRVMGEAMHDLSPWTMFLNADWLVKTVMLGLAFASLVTWTIFVAKTIEIGRAKYRLRLALVRADKAGSMDDARAATNAVDTAFSLFLEAAGDELRLSSDTTHSDGVRERAASRFLDIAKGEASGVRRGMGLLATIGATAPFVGLFGTVWGIMNSFIGISKSQTTNLAVVAPGIAEALLATAIGLVAAIPAVIIYNHFSRETKSYLDLVNRASGAAGRLLSRDLDRHGAWARARAEA